MANKFDKVLTAKSNSKIKKVYRYKHFSTHHLVLVPLMYLAAGECWLREKLYSFCSWNEKRTNRIITTCFLKFAEINQKDSSLTAPFSLFAGYTRWVNNCSRRDINYCKKFGMDIQEYFVKEFEMNGYTKLVKEDYDSDWYWITFKKK